MEGSSHGQLSTFPLEITSIVDDGTQNNVPLRQKGDHYQHKVIMY